MGRLTIKEIAQQAGVSVSTVSRVLNNSGNVNIEIKERVQEVLKETCFRPNASARNLKSNKTNSIGLIISDISDRYYSRMTKCFVDLLSERGYGLIVYCTNGSSDREKGVINLLAEKNVDGIIINTCGENDSEIISLSELIPTVLVNRGISGKAKHLDYVGSDDIEGMYNLTLHLIEKGHANIGLINGNMKLSTAKDRYEGFKRAISTIKPEHNIIHYHKNFSMETGYEGFASILENETHPTAIIAANDSIALGAMRFAKNNNIKIPNDISFATYGSMENDSLFFVKPTCVTSNPLLIGRYVVNCIFERLSNRIQPSSRIVLSTTIEEGNSTMNICPTL